MAGLSMDIRYVLRKVEFTLPYSLPDRGIERHRLYEGRSHGCFQEGGAPSFVVELTSGDFAGRCVYVPPENIKFIKEDDECCV